LLWLTKPQVLNTTAHLHHRSPLPAGTTLAQAQRVFRNHDALLRLDPDLQTYEETGPTVGEARPNTKYYSVTDAMHALPAGLWDTTVRFSAEITDRDDGVEWVVRAPMGLVQTSLWTVERDEAPPPPPPAAEGEGEGEREREREDQGERWTLVEDVTIRCSRLLVGTVRGKCEENWRGTHERWAAQLAKERENDAS
jgi:hypothetical protein